MEQSTIHIKAPHTIHIGAKVLAAKSGTSMNQLIVDLISEAMKKDGLKETTVEKGIKYTRNNPDEALRSIKQVFPEAEVITKEPECPRHHVPLNVCRNRH